MRNFKQRMTTSLPPKVGNVVWKNCSRATTEGHPDFRRRKWCYYQQKITNGMKCCEHILRRRMMGRSPIRRRRSGMRWVVVMTGISSTGMCFPSVIGMRRSCIRCICLLWIRRTRVVCCMRSVCSWSTATCTTSTTTTTTECRCYDNKEQYKNENLFLVVAHRLLTKMSHRNQMVFFKSENSLCSGWPSAEWMLISLSENVLVVVVIVVTLIFLTRAIV